MVYRRRRGRIGRRGRPGRPGRSYGRRGRRGRPGIGFGPRVSCRILRRKMSVAHGRRGRGRILGMMARNHCFRRGGRRRFGRSGPGY